MYAFLRMALLHLAAKMGYPSWEKALELFLCQYEAWCPLLSCYNLIVVAISLAELSLDATLPLENASSSHFVSDQVRGSRFATGQTWTPRWWLHSIPIALLKQDKEAKLAKWTNCYKMQLSCATQESIEVQIFGSAPFAPTNGQTVNRCSPCIRWARRTKAWGRGLWGSP